MSMHAAISATAYLENCLLEDNRHHSSTSDDSQRVADWLGCGDLVRIGDLHAEQWEKSDERFMAVVVTPFVLMQGIA